MPVSSRRARRNSRAGTIRLFLVLAMLVGVNVYFLGFRGGTSIGALLRTARVKTPVEAPAPKEAKPAALPEDPIAGRIVDGQLADGQTIAQALTPHLGRKRAGEIEETLAGELDLGSVRAGQPWVIVYDAEDRPTLVEFRAAPTLTYRIDLAGAHLALSTLSGRAETRIVEVTLPPGPAMWEALRRSGEGPALGERLCELYAGEGDLCGPGAAAGERVRALVEKRLIGGRLHRYGRVLGAEWATRSGVRRAFFWSGAEPGYYTERGESLARTARLTPFRGSRNVVRGRPVASKVGETLQIEYPAPSGGGQAMACAIAAGTVTGITRAATGVTLTLKVGEHEHHTYAHLGRLARGLGLGSLVEQGQALGRADNGLSLGLDGDAAVRGAHTLAPRMPALPEPERPRFGESIAPRLERLRALSLRSADPLASRGLSAIP